MGGKSKQEAPPPVSYPDMSMQNEQMAQMMQAMMGMQMSMANQQPQAPMLAPAPELNKEASIDWSDKHKELAAKMKADFNVDKARKKGRNDTVLTSPLLDEEDSSTTKSLLAGS
jgi:predicted metal-dependent peptidase